jgi:hypothetical protein
LLDLTSIDLVKASWWMALAVVVSGSLAILRIYGTFGAVSAGISGLVFFDYTHEHIGGISTELPGFTFGILALAALLQASHDRSWASFFIGFALSVIAMQTRAGAAFVLPALVVWAYFSIKPVNGRRWIVPFGAIVMCALMFGAHGALTRSVSPKSGGSFINAPEIWYATIIEGRLLLGQRSEDTVIPVTRWVQMFLDFPEIESLSVDERPTRKLNILIDAATDTPLAAIVGATREIAVYIFRFRMFNFIEFKPLRVSLTLLTILGFFLCCRSILRGKGEETDSLFVLCGLAIVVSQPFMYGGETRASAPTVGFLAALAGIGARHVCACVSRLLKGTNQCESEIHLTGTESNAALLAAFVAAAIFAVILHGGLAGAKWATNNVGCKSNGQIGPVYLNVNASVKHGPSSDWTGTKLKLRQQEISDLYRDKSMFAAMAFDVNERIFGEFAEIVISWQRPHFVGVGLDLTDGRLYHGAISDVNNSTSTTHCAKMGPNYLKVFSIP